MLNESPLSNKFSRSLAIFLCASLFPAFTSSAQASPQNQSSTPASAPQQPPTIRVTTRLIEVTVVVQDKDGKPIPGLKKEDFSLFDEGQPQNLAFFSSNTPAQTQIPTAPLPPNFFTNRSDLKGEDPGATIIILFDALNTAFEDQSFARQQILRFLQTVKPQDHVAIFALTDNLIVLHGFSEDAAALANSVTRFSPQLLAAFDSSRSWSSRNSSLTNPTSFPSAGGGGRRNSVEGQFADSRTVDRFQITYAAIVALADSVSLIPGHKSLVWVSGGIPIQLGGSRIGVPDRDNFRFDTQGKPGDKNSGGVDGLTRVLNRANMAIYPIDVHGIDVNDSSWGFFLRQNRRDTFRVLADKTGGKAFYGTNDVSAAINSAFEDGRYTYTLGFYPNHGVWDGKFRELKVKVSTEGAQLRYRRGYFAFPDRSKGEVEMKTDLQQAAHSPLDATGLGISVRVKNLSSSSSSSLVQLQVSLDPKQFLLHQVDQRNRGGLDLLFLQKDSSGKFLAAEKQHFDVNFAPKEYEFLAKAGLILQRRLSIDPVSSELRVFVRDTGSGSLGSVTIPVKQLLQ